MMCMARSGGIRRLRASLGQRRPRAARGSAIPHIYIYTPLPITRGKNCRARRCLRSFDIPSKIANYDNFVFNINKFQLNINLLGPRKLNNLFNYVNIY